jgi:hypothetical protein
MATTTHLAAVDINLQDLILILSIHLLTLNPLPSYHH